MLLVDALKCSITSIDKGAMSISRWCNDESVSLDIDELVVGLFNSYFLSGLLDLIDESLSVLTSMCNDIRCNDHWLLHHVDVSKISNVGCCSKLRHCSWP